MIKFFLRSKSLVCVLALLAIPVCSFADEGMWLIHLLEKNLARQMKAAGLKIDPKVIYDENAASISDAVVALDFGCTGSIISEEGLLITNHHCAYGDIHANSTPQRNLLEEGFWAMNRGEEIPIKGKSVFFLRKVLDVTDEVKALSDSLKAGRPGAGGMMMRRTYATIEKKYAQLTGMEPMCVSMWSGSKYMMFFYDVYTDVRLVGAPPVSIAAFGGDTDNWEWPQHKGDFALYRVYAGKDGKPAEYASDNVPLKPKRMLTISSKGVKDKDFTMILGFPGSTNRYNSSFGVNQIMRVTNPVSVKVWGDQLAIMNKWMERDPEIRLKYADTYFGISNVQELQAGEVYNFRRLGVVGVKEAQEREMQAWIDSDPQRKAEWGSFLSDMGKAYAGGAEIYRDRQYFRSTLFQGGLYRNVRRLSSLRTAFTRHGVDTLAKTDSLFRLFVQGVRKGYEEIDCRVEQELVFYNIATFLAHVPRVYWGEYITGLADKFGGDATALTAYVLDRSIFSDPAKFEAFVASGDRFSVEELISDPFYQLLSSSQTTSFNEAEERAIGETPLSTYNSNYTRLLYQMRVDKGVVQYPDANSTMRLTYGTVGPLHPSDGIDYASHSTTQGYWDKYNPDVYEFNMTPKMIDLLKKSDWGRWADKKDKTMHVDFLSNMDITGGNSGSPVLNASGELIGLAFDGNKESLGGDAYFHPDYNKTVSVDIRFVMWIIEYYSPAGYLLGEMKIN